MKDYKYPCVLDLKMGDKTWCDDFPAKRIQDRIALDKITTQNLLGFRFCGMKLKNKDLNVTVDKMMRVEVHTREEVKAIVKEFLGNCPDKEANKYYIERLKKLQDTIRKSGYRFFSSSVIFCYDAFDGKKDLRLIDFSHYFNMKTKISSVEDGVCFGIDNAIKIMNEFN